MWSKGHQELVPHRYALADVLGRQGRTAAALRELDDAIALHQQAGVNTGAFADLYEKKGSLLEAQGRLEAALRAHQESLRLHERFHTPERERDQAVHGLGLIELRLGRLDDAIAHLERALQLRAPGQIPRDPRADTAFALARALAQKHRDEARACALGLEAADLYRQSGDHLRSQLRDVQHWLDSQACVRPS
jgi:tetratricopeptide (TPR) repeat protein